VTYGCFNYKFNIALIGVLLIWINNIIFSFEKLKERIVFCFFNVTIFVFLLSRPTISMFRNNQWWYFNNESVVFSLIGLYISILFLFLGAILAEELLKKKYKNVFKTKPFQINENKSFIKSLQIISFAAFCITAVCFFMGEVEKLIFMNGREYEEFYIEFTSKLPYVISTIGSMMKYCICIFLATLPSKKISFFVLCVYVISALPSLIIGMRNPIVLNTIFAVLYYIIRDLLENSKRWFGKIEKIVVTISVPAAMLFLSAYNYIRAGTQSKSGSIWDSIVDLFYKQGVSYDVLNIGYNSIPNLPNKVPKNYTFGTIIDYFTHNNLAQALFGAKDLGTGNSVVMAEYSNSFAHSMSYVAKDDYLQGHGWGTSYILETYADFGYLGIILFSLIFGALLIYLVYLCRKGCLSRTIVFMIFTTIFFTPRAEAVSSITFLFTMQFWVCVGACFLLAKACQKEYSFISNKNNLINCRRIQKCSKISG
ncbi:MAG: O-antigen polysaccharide polymerase Wzy family protein, partial [Clostridia bacterium]